MTFSVTPLQFNNSTRRSFIKTRVINHNNRILTIRTPLLILPRAEK